MAEQPTNPSPATQKHTTPSHLQALNEQQLQQFSQQACAEANRARTGVVFCFYHQQPQQPTFTVEARYGHVVESEEQPYQRQLTLADQWQPLDCGWLDPLKINTLIIQNNEGRFAVVPTEAEKKDVAQRIVEVGIQSSSGIILCWKVQPGRVMHVEPANAQLLFLRAQHGKIRCSITLMAP